MESNLVVSLDIAQRILDAKKSELSMLTVNLQDVPDLDDQLVALMAEFWYVTTREVEALEKLITDLQEQKKIFGAKGLPKELEMASKEDYPRS